VGQKEIPRPSADYFVPGDRVAGKEGFLFSFFEIVEGKLLHLIFNL
jgi:hypothetical protein